MKRRLNKRAALLLALALCLPAAPGLAMDKGQALDKAYELIKAYLRYGEEALDPYQSAATQGGGWRMSFQLKRHAPDNDGLVIVELDGEGGLAEILGPRPLDDREQLTSAVQAISPLHYTVDAMRRLQARFGLKLPGIRREIREAWGEDFERRAPYDWMYQLARALSFGFADPGEGALTAAQAEEKARAYAAEAAGWSEEGLQMMRMRATLHYHSPYYGKPVWLIVLGQHRISDPEYENGGWERFHRLYLSPLYRLFGGDNNSTPAYISLTLDGATGALLEDPFFPYPGADGIPHLLSRMR